MREYSLLHALSTWLIASLLIALSAEVGAADSADFPLHVTFTQTDMSAAGPELHILIENETAQEQSFLVVPRAKDRSGPPCAPAAASTTRSERDKPWHSRREQVGAFAGVVVAKGWTHRVYAFGDLIRPCHFEVNVSVGAIKQSYSVSIDRQDRAPVLDTSRPPSVSISGLAQPDQVPGNFLVHVLVRNNSPFDFNVAIVNRSIECAGTVVGQWDGLEDVPQGLSTGPARLTARGWTAFVSVAKLSDSEQSSRCEVEMDVAFEKRPKAYVHLGKLRMRLEPQGTQRWAAAD